MLRLNKVKEMWNNPHYKKLMVKLKNIELDFLENFIKENENLDRNDFVHKVNRVFLDKPDKPKNFAVLQEILTVVA